MKLIPMMAVPVVLCTTLSAQEPPAISPGTGGAGTLTREVSVVGIPPPAGFARTRST